MLLFHFIHYTIESLLLLLYYVIPRLLFMIFINYIFEYLMIVKYNYINNMCNIHFQTNINQANLISIEI